MSGVEEAPVVTGIDIAVALGILAELVVALALRLLYAVTLGLLLSTLADALSFTILHKHVNLGGPLDALNLKMERAIGGYVLATEHHFALWLNANEKVFSWTWRGISWFGWQAHDFGTNLVNHTIPSLVGNLTHGVRSTVTHTVRTVTHTTRVVERHIVRVEKATAARVEDTFGRAWRGIDHIESVVIPRLWHVIHATQAEVASVRGWERRVADRRFTRLEKALSAGVLGGVAVAALTRVFPYWRCSNVKRFMRGVCRSPFGSLDWLFGLAALTVTALDIEQIYHVASDLTDELGNLFERIES